MRILKNKALSKWAVRKGLSDAALQIAVAEIGNGLIDADLGEQVIKKRVPLIGRGKSGGARTLLAYREQDKAIFVYGFAKNRRSNIKPDELKALKMLAIQLLGYSDKELDKAVEKRILIEVSDDE